MPTGKIHWQPGKTGNFLKMKEMSPEDKSRIETEAKEHAKHYHEYDSKIAGRFSYMAGAESEHSRIAELLKEERNKAIQECIVAMLNDQDILFNGSDILGKLESLKSQ